MNRPLQWVLLAAFLGPLLGIAQGPRSALEISRREAAEHRIGERGPIYTNFVDDAYVAACDVDVGTDGKVMNAQTSNGFIFDLTPLCKTWRYKPFERDGQPVTAKVREAVTILPIGELTEVHARFPEIHDWSSLRITLSRSGCYGNCAAYEIEIRGDGTALYDGQANVGTTGKKKARISHASLVKLVGTFRKVDYFSLAAGYAAGVTDMPTCVTSISFDGVSKSVLDYVGREARMPPGVSDVEVAIDRLLGAYRWVERK
jgi:hypothetical protein